MAYGKITAKQKEILEFIKAEILRKGYPPSVREICEAVNLKSTSSVHSHLETLEKNGYIRRDPTKPRAIEIMDDSFQMVRHEMTSVPIVGTVAAGIPILAEQNIEGYFPIPAEMVPAGESFVLKVKGDSMINAGIFNGDQILHPYACVVKFLGYVDHQSQIMFDQDGPGLLLPFRSQHGDHLCFLLAVQGRRQDIGSPYIVNLPLPLE